MVKDIRLFGFNFTKISAEKNPNYQGKVDIKSNVAITNIEKFRGDSKQEALKVEFKVDANYGALGSVELQGNLYISADPKSMKDTLSNWKDKKEPTELQVAIINLVLQKTTIKAIQIEEEIGLPIHVQNIFPRVQTGKKESK